MEFQSNSSRSVNLNETWKSTTVDVQPSWRVLSNRLPLTTVAITPINIWTSFAAVCNTFNTLRVFVSRVYSTVLGRLNSLALAHFIVYLSLFHYPVSQFVSCHGNMLSLLVPCSSGTWWERCHGYVPPMKGQPGHPTTSALRHHNSSDAEPTTVWMRINFI